MNQAALAVAGSLTGRKCRLGFGFVESLTDQRCWKLVASVVADSSADQRCCLEAGSLTAQRRCLLMAPVVADSTLDGRHRSLVVKMGLHCSDSRMAREARIQDDLRCRHAPET